MGVASRNCCATHASESERVTNYPSRRQFDDGKEIQRLKPDIDKGKKESPYVFCVILEESGPGWREQFGWANACDVNLYGVLGNRETNLEEFTLFRQWSP